MNKSRANALFKRLLATGDSDTAYDLLQEFYLGYPLERLRQLLRSETPSVLSCGVMIASELGARICPLVDEFGPLLASDDWHVRYGLLECVLECATENHGSLIAQVMKLVHDPERRVREKVLVILSCATESQLRAGARFLEESELRKAMLWLASEQSTVGEEILARLSGTNTVNRRLAAVAAARRARPERIRGGFKAHASARARTDPLTLVVAASSADPEVASFAQSELRVNNANP